MQINKGHREGLNQTYVAKSWPRVIINGFLSKKGCQKTLGSQQRKSVKRWPVDNVNHSEVKLRDAYLNGERNTWSEEPSLQGNETPCKGERPRVSCDTCQTREQSIMAAHQSTSIQEFSCALTSPLSTI